MPSAFGHALVGFTVADASEERRLLLLLPICAALPDIDVIAFRLGIPYGHPFGHRGFTHSLLFAALVGLIGSLSIQTAHRWRTAALFFLATASHGLLDARVVRRSMPHRQDVRMVSAALKSSQRAPMAVSLDTGARP